ncbi:MAG: PAS domain-containing protein [Anaerolineales bacterium]|nr:PAS domain-containing protein [Anaerolineales bacterium]
MHTNTSSIWLSLLTAVFLLTLAVYSGRRRSVPGALPFMIGALFAAFWVLGISLEYAAADMAAQIFWRKVQIVCALPATTAITCFILDYVWPGRWLTRRNVILLTLPCLLLLILTLTDDAHRLFSFQTAVSPSAPPTLMPAAGLFFLYSYTLNLIALGALGWLFLQHRAQRWAIVVIIIGQIGARTLFALDFTRQLNADLPTAVLAIAFVFLGYAVVLFGFHIFDLDTQAAQVATEQMRAGMIVLNAQGQISSLNPAARRMLGLPAQALIGRPLAEFLPLAAVNFHTAEAGLVEVGLGSAAARRIYGLTASSLTDWRDREMAHVLLLHDITEQKQAQAQLMAQQRALAALQERERLARELHDSLGQTLAATHLQASAARQLLAQGRLEQTDHCLTQLAEMSIAAEADVRDYLLGAKTAFAADTPFLETLRQYVLRFGQQYHLQVALDTPPELETESLGFPVEVQLLRVIQEALSNVRKHAAAQTVQIRFALTGACVEVRIADNGRGFDPTLAQRTDGYGLQAMRERAAILGGTLDIRSQPGAGTHIIIQAPRQTVARPTVEETS